MLGIGRYYKGEKLIALFNFSELPQTAWIREPEPYVDLLTGKARPAKDITLDPYDFAWLFLKMKF